MTAVTLGGMLGAADGMTRSFLASTYPAVARSVAAPVYYGAVLYWALHGYKVMAGHAALDWSELVAKAAMTAIVFGTLNWGGLAGVLYEAFVAAMNGTAATIMAGEPTVDMLDALWVNVNAVSDTLRNSSLYEMGMILDGFGLWIVNTILFAIALGYLTLAKFGLAITMVLLPLFIGFGMFPLTRQWLMNWLGYMMSFAFLYILVIAIVRFGFAAFGDAVREAGQAAGVIGSKGVRSALTAELFLLETSLCIFMWRAREWAGSLAGATTSSSGALMLVMRGAWPRGGQRASRGGR